MKLVAIMLSVTMMLGISNICWAQSSSDRNCVQIDIVEDLLNPEDFEKVNEELIALGKAELTKRVVPSKSASGYPVLVGMAPDGSGNTHFVTAYGYNGDTIYIYDPASGRNYTTLAQYLSSYCVNRLYVFKK